MGAHRTTTPGVSTGEDDGEGHLRHNLHPLTAQSGRDLSSLLSGNAREKDEHVKVRTPAADGRVPVVRDTLEEHPAVLDGLHRVGRGELSHAPLRFATAKRGSSLWCCPFSVRGRKRAPASVWMRWATTSSRRKGARMSCRQARHYWLQRHGARPVMYVPSAPVFTCTSQPVSGRVPQTTAAPVTRFAS